MKRTHGFEELDCASTWPEDSPQWVELTVGLGLEAWKAPAVRAAIQDRKHPGWRGAPNPQGYIHTAAMRIATRMGLHADGFSGAHRSRLCPCGTMNTSEANAVEHKCHTLKETRLCDLESSTKSQGKIIDERSYEGIETEGSFWEQDSKGTYYQGSSELRYVARSLILLEEVPDEENVARVDWAKVAARAGLSEIVAVVMEWRFRDRLPLATLAADPENGNAFSAAWRQIDRQLETIKTVLRTPDLPTPTATPRTREFHVWP